MKYIFRVFREDNNTWYYINNIHITGFKITGFKCLEEFKYAKVYRQVECENTRIFLSSNNYPFQMIVWNPLVEKEYNMRLKEGTLFEYYEDATGNFDYDLSGFSKLLIKKKKNDVSVKI